MINRNIKIVTLSAVAVLMLGGCANNFVPTDNITANIKGAGVDAPKKFRSSFVGGEVKDGWLKTFHDPTLNRLVKEAQKSNPDLTIAASRVEKAAALMQMSYSNAIPHLGLNGSFTDRNWDYNYKDRDDRHYKAQGYLSLSWEPDIWGRIANDTASKADNTIATLADYEWMRQSLSANTAKAWFLVGSDKMIEDFYRHLVKIDKDAERILTKRAKIGQGNMRDVHMIRGMVAEAQDSLQAIKASKAEHTRALETLIGRYPSNSIKAHYLRGVRGSVPTGVPMGLLNRRPDIIAAQYRVASAFHNTEAMKLLKLPSIKLSLQLGADSIEQTLSKLIGSLFMPIYDAGKIDAKIAAASADQKAAIANYKKVVLRAYREVENAISNDRYLSQRYRYLNTMVKEYKAAYDMTNKNYKIGQGTILDVLQAQSKWINARILRTVVLRDRLINRVNLHLALGGSFDKYK